MPFVNKLYGKHKSSKIYIIGTGPSIQFIHKSIFYDEITIGLNQAYKYYKFTYGLTIHPELIPYDFMKWNTQWITKTKPTSVAWKKHCILGNNRRFFKFFSNKEQVFDFSYAKKTDENFLYVGRGIQTAAIVLAARMGAQFIILAGCDMCSLDNNHHGHNQHIRKTQYDIDEVYKEYYYYTVKIREIVKKEYNSEVLVLTPFLSSKYCEEDYKRLKYFYNTPELPQPKIVEKNDQRIEKYIICDYFQ